MNRPARCATHTNHHQAGCGDCRRYAREYRTYRHTRIAAGTWNVRRVPAEPVRTHIRNLLNAGMRLADIADKAGVPIGTLNRITYIPRIVTCQHATADAILALQAEPVDRWSVDGTGTRRRLQALMRAGWSQLELAERLGADHSVVSTWATLPDGGKVAPDTADMVRVLYDRLNVHDGTNSRARAWAASRSWYPPEAWSDHTIDDPHAEPYSWCRQLVDDVAVRRALAGELRWADLTDTDRLEVARRSADQAGRTALARRLGIAGTTLTDWARRATADTRLVGVA